MWAETVWSIERKQLALFFGSAGAVISHAVVYNIIKIKLIH